MTRSGFGSSSSSSSLRAQHQWWPPARPEGSAGSCLPRLSSTLDELRLDVHTHPLLSCLPQSADDLLVASAECPSDDEDIDPCDPSSGELRGSAFSWFCAPLPDYHEFFMRSCLRRQPARPHPPHPRLLSSPSSSVIHPFCPLSPSFALSHRSPENEPPIF